MRNTILLPFLLLLALNCLGQNTIIDITENRGYNVDGAYYKDTNNLLNVFEGTYVYAHNADTLTIVFQKKTMSRPPSNRYYEDLIIGEYKYVKNGVVIVNTMDLLDVPHTDQTWHTIDGSLLLTGALWGCPECGANEKRLRGTISDDFAKRFADIDMRRIVEDGQQVMKIWIGWTTGTKVVGEPVPPKPRLPGGNYTLIKQ